MENELLNGPLEQSAEYTPKGGNRRTRKWWVWLIVAVVLAGIVVGAAVIRGHIKETEANKYIDLVRNYRGAPFEYTFGDILEGRHENPKWSYIGNGVVEFQGDDRSETNILQFLVDIETGTISYYAMFIDDESQDLLYMVSHVQVMRDVFVRSLSDSVENFDELDEDKFTAFRGGTGVLVLRYSGMVREAVSDITITTESGMVIKPAYCRDDEGYTLIWANKELQVQVGDTVSVTLSKEGYEDITLTLYVNESM